LGRSAAEDAGGAGQTLFRADTRAPGEVFDRGFSPKGNNMDLWEHVTRNPSDSGYVATSKSLRSAQDFNQDYLGGAGNIYKLRGSGIDVNARFGANSPYPWENEVAVPRPISGSCIEGCWLPGGQWVPNPGYSP
jgi:Scabin-like